MPSHARYSKFRAITETKCNPRQVQQQWRSSYSLICSKISVFQYQSFGLLQGWPYERLLTATSPPLINCSKIFWPPGVTRFLSIDKPAQKCSGPDWSQKIDNNQPLASTKRMIKHQGKSHIKLTGQGSIEGFKRPTLLTSHIIISQFFQT